MIVSGCDVGALATKTVILNDGSLLGWDLTPNEGRLGRVAEESLARVLKATGLDQEEIASFSGTWWGKKYIPYPHRSESLINGLARGARWVRPSVRTVVDIGGLTTTVTLLKEQGGVLEYRNNEPLCFRDWLFYRTGRPGSGTIFGRIGPCGRPGQE